MQKFDKKYFSLLWISEYVYMNPSENSKWITSGIFFYTKPLQMIHVIPMNER